MSNQSRVYSGKYNIHEPISSLFEEIENRDILGRRHLAGRILKRLGDADCPRVLGVYGGWGTGKTSLKNMLIHQNGGIAGGAFRILDVDAWKYEASGGLLIPIIVQLKELTGNADLPDVWRLIVMRAAVTAGIAIADGLLKPIGVVPSRIGEIYDTLSSKDNQTSYESILERWEQQVDEIAETEKAFERLVKAAVEKQNGKKILICVDNLDRCSPENVVRLLESVKVFFNASDCIWIFAIDSDVVAGYVNKKYEGVGVDGYSYLDKIIPEQYHLSLSPVVDRQVINTLLRYAVGLEQHSIVIEKIPQIPKILVPRRLIKSARKLAEFYRGKYATSGVPVETVMALSLLYHTWPDFYQRLSSTSEDHIRRIMDNFFQNEPQLSHPLSIPLREELLKDSELTYFIRTAFEGIWLDSSKSIRDIINGLTGLRECGLP
ncbi:MAG: hypothetical protein KDD74_10230 [Anaerolineales bacterium]|nr:hypothetical protein [Anaerolineales bacterium]